MPPERPLRAALGALRRSLTRYWAAAPGALKDHLNTDELTRITVTSLTAGGGLFGLVQTLSLNAETLFPASGDAALAAAVLTMILEIRRRLGQGADPAARPGPPACRDRREPGRGGPSFGGS